MCSELSICILDLSYCFWIKLDNLRTAKILHEGPNNKQGFGFKLQKNYGFIKLKNVDLLFDYNFLHVPNRWVQSQHILHYIN